MLVASGTRYHGQTVGHCLRRIALLEQLVLRLGVVRMHALLAKDAAGHVWSMRLGRGRAVLAGLALARRRLVLSVPQIFHEPGSALPLLAEALVEFRGLNGLSNEL